MVNDEWLVMIVVVDTFDLDYEALGTSLIDQTKRPSRLALRFSYQLGKDVEGIVCHQITLQTSDRSLTTDDAVVSQFEISAVFL